MKHLKNDAILFIVVVLIAVAGILFIFHQKNKAATPPNTATTQNVNDSMIQKLEEGFQGYTWGQPTNTNQSTGPTGELPGRSVTGTATINNASIPRSSDTEQEKYLESLGFKINNDIAADGVDGSMWGYSREVDGVTQVVIFSSKITSGLSTNQNEPIQFNCPCDTNITIFVSNLPSKAQSNASLANPASVNCKDKGGTTSIQNGPNGQYGLCEFEDNMACEEWAMYRGECPVGGIKTTGYDNVEQMYCAWVGGKTLAVPNAQCTLPNGKVCSDTALYNGTCGA